MDPTGTRRKLYNYKSSTQKQSEGTPPSIFTEPAIGEAATAMPLESSKSLEATSSPEATESNTADRKTRLAMIEDHLGFLVENNEEFNALVPILDAQTNPLAVETHLEEVYRKQDTERAKATARLWNPSVQGKGRKKAIETSKIDPIDSLWAIKRSYGEYAQKAAMDRSFVAGISELIGTRMDGPNQKLKDAPDFNEWMMSANGNTRRGLISLARFSEITKYMLDQGEDVLHRSKLIDLDPNKNDRIQTELGNLPRRTLLLKADRLTDSLANKSLFWADREQEAAKFYAAIRSGKVAIRQVMYR